MSGVKDAQVDAMVSQTAIPSRQHLGLSLKDLGKHCFAFSRMDDLAYELRQKLEINFQHTD